MIPKRIALIGIGNIMFCDEGVGAYVVESIRLNYRLPENLTVVEGGTLGFKLMTYYQTYDVIIVVGTGSHAGQPGTIAIRNAEALIQEGKVKKTANEVEIAMMIEICSFHEKMGQVELVSIVPEDIVSVRNGVSDTIKRAMPELEKSVLARLRYYGVEAVPKNATRVSFDTIIEAFANPTQIWKGSTPQPDKTV